MYGSIAFAFPAQYFPCIVLVPLSLVPRFSHFHMQLLNIFML